MSFIHLTNVQWVRVMCQELYWVLEDKTDTIPSSWNSYLVKKISNYVYIINHNESYPGKQFWGKKKIVSPKLPLHQWSWISETQFWEEKRIALLLYQAKGDTAGFCLQKLYISLGQRALVRSCISTRGSGCAGIVFLSCGLRWVSCWGPVDLNLRLSDCDLLSGMKNTSSSS